MSSQFAQSPFAHSQFALYRFAPLPLRSTIFSPTYHFALLPIHPLPICPMPSCPFIILPLHHFPHAILPIYRLNPLSFHHSVSLNLLTTAHDFLVLELNSYLVPGKDSRNPCLLFPGRTWIVNSVNCEFDDFHTNTDVSKWISPSRHHGCIGHTSMSSLRPRIS